MTEEKDMLKGSPWHSLIYFAIPVLGALFLQSLYGAVDMLIVGKFAETADISGVATGSIFINTINNILSGFAVGVTVYVGQKIGEGNMDKTSRAIGTGVALFIVIAIVMSIFLLLFSTNITSMLHAPAEAFDNTNMYIKICGGGMIFVIFYNIIGAILRGVGDSRTPFLTVLIACFINIIGDLILVAGFHMGAAGAAIATVFAQGVSVICSIAIVLRKKFNFELGFRFIRFDKEITKSIVKLGTPIGFQEFLIGMSFIVIRTVVNSISVTASAGMGIAEKICGFTMLVSSAFYQSVSVFTAHNIGANQHKRAKLGLKYGIMTAMPIAIVIASITFFKGDFLASIFTNTNNPMVISRAHQYLKAYSIDTVLTSILFCYIGYYNGCGKTFFVMMRGIISALAVRIPVVLFMRSITDSSLFLIGLAAPITTTFELLCCIWYAYYLRKHNNI